MDCGLRVARGGGGGGVRIWTNNQTRSYADFSSVGWASLFTAYIQQGTESEREAEFVVWMMVDWLTGSGTGRQTGSQHKPAPRTSLYPSICMYISRNGIPISFFILFVCRKFPLFHHRPIE